MAAAGGHLDCKDDALTERYALKYAMDIFNVTNTASFDIPIDDVTQNETFRLPSTRLTRQSTLTALYTCPSFSGLGITNKTIGSPRQIQMSLSLTFYPLQQSAKILRHLSDFKLLFRIQMKQLRFGIRVCVADGKGLLRRSNFEPVLDALLAGCGACLSHR